MLFFEPSFVLGFLPAFVFSVYLARNNLTILRWVIAAYSTLFYLLSAPQYYLLFFSVMIVTYSFQYVRRLPGRTLQFALFLAILLGVLGFYKYANWIASMAGLPAPRADATLPLGISFYIFQSIIFLHWQSSRDEKVKALDLYNYVSFFPHMIAGPLTRPSELLEPLRTLKPKFLTAEVSLGLMWLVIGVVKKVVIADNLAIYSQIAFESEPEPQGYRAIAAVLAYPLQLYFDFSGYMDMARGIALMVGVTLPINFYRPYRALNLADFWRRWHITLTRVITSLVYTPLVVTISRRFQNAAKPETWLKITDLGVLFITMCLIGIWHGANMTFLVFGAMHGAGLVIDRLLGEIRAKAFAIPKAIIRLLLMWFVVIVGFAFFRASSVDRAVLVLSSMFQREYGLAPETPMAVFMIVTGYLLAIVPPVSATVLAERLTPWTRTALALIIYLLAIAFMDVAAPFLYWNF